MLRRPLAAGVAVAAVLAFAPAAAATHTYTGGCTLAVAGERRTNGRWDWTGVMTADVRAGSGPAEPVTVRCEIWVDGAYDGTYLTASGGGHATGAAPVTLTTPDRAVIAVCDVVTAGSEETTTCRDTTVAPWGHPLVEPLFDVMDSLWAVWDPTTCPLLAALAPGVPGVLDVTSEGDVRAGGTLLWDCPPYADDEHTYATEVRYSTWR